MINMKTKDRTQYFIEYRKINKEKFSKQAANWYRTNITKIKNKRRKNREENKEKLRKYYAEYRKNNKEKIKEDHLHYRLRNRKKIRNLSKLFRQNNKSHIARYDKQYAKEHPQIMAASQKRHVMKLGIFHNFSLKKTKYALTAWSKAIRNRDKNTCQICGKKGKFAHHILHKSKYPLLAFNTNNGISLCKRCHNEVHFPIRRDN